MAIHWNLTKCDKLPKNEKGGTTIPQITDAIIFGTIGVGISRITKKNFMEFYRRYAALEIASDTSFLRSGGFDSGGPFYLRPSHIEMHIGLQTNASEISLGVFKKRLAQDILDRVKDRERGDKEVDLEIADEESDFVVAKIYGNDNRGHRGWFSKETNEETGIVTYTPRGFGGVIIGESFTAGQVLKEINILPTPGGYLPFLQIDLAAGDVVKVYEDPMTCEKLEGKAELLERLDPDPADGWNETWKVRFTEDAKGNPDGLDPDVERKINLGHC